MDKILQKIISQIPYDLFSDTALQTIFPGSPHSRYGWIKRALASGDLIHLKRGLYLLGQPYRRQALEPFAIAQRIYGPSYISFESALSYHGWIPEAVHTFTSACSKRSYDFENKIGFFSYQRVLSQPLLCGVDYHKTKAGVFLMASPIKALADYVYCYKKDWNNTHPLLHSLRIDEDHLSTIDWETFSEIEKAYKSKRVQKFLKGVRKELKK